MKHFLAKLRVSSSLDEGQPISPNLKNQIEKSPQLRTFVGRTQDLHERLTQSRPPHPSWVSVRESVRLAIRISQSERRASLRSIQGRLVGACALASLMLLAGWIGANLPAPTGRFAEHKMPSASPALNQGELVALLASGAVLAPLTEEWRRLSLDLEKTADYLLASLP